MKQTGLWNSLERWIAPATVLAEWREVLGGEFALAKPFLRGTGEGAEEYPCRQKPRCGCQHEVIHHSTDRIVAACRCDERECKTFALRREEILIHGLDWGELNAAVRSACGFETPWEMEVGVIGESGTHLVGTYGDLSSPVFLTIRQKEREFLREMEALMNGQGEPFIVLTPTERHLTSAVRAGLRRKQGVAIPLSRHLVWDGAGKFEAGDTLRAVLGRFARGLSGRGEVAARAIQNHQGERPRASFSFRQAGDRCEVVFYGSKVFHINNTDGAKYLDYLLHHPNQPIRAFDLETTIKAERASARAGNSIQKAVDEKTKREAGRELVELKAELEEEEATGSSAKIKRLNEEIGELEALVGNERLLDGDTGEKARNNVRKAIGKVASKLEKGDKTQKAFGRHITQFVLRGHEVIYNRPEGIVWG